MREVLIELATGEVYPVNPGIFPAITHARIVNLNWEIGRAAEAKDGWIEIWIAKGYLMADGDIRFFEAPGLAGMNIKILDPQLPDVITQITGMDDLEVEVCKVLSQALIDLGYINGTVVVLNE